MRLLGLAVAAISILIDQAHKYWMIYGLKLPNNFIDGKPILESGGGYIEVTSFFNIVMVWNYGVSFGMFNQGKQDVMQAFILSAVAVLIVIFLLFWLFKQNSKWTSVAIGLVIGGALGNVIDRVMYGAVADFFDFHFNGYHWPAFNIADSAIFIGVLMLVLDSFFNISKKHV